MENEKESLVDGSGTGLQVSVITSTDDPTKNGLVVCGPDGATI